MIFTNCSELRELKATLPNSIGAAEVKEMVKCPHCGNKFSPEEAIQHDVRERLEREFDMKLQANTKALISKIQQEEQSKFKVQVQRLEQDRKAPDNRTQ